MTEATALSFLRLTRLAAACVLAATAAVAAEESVTQTDTGIDPDVQETVADPATIGRSSNVEAKLSAEFSEFLGGEENAADVVQGLRTGQGFSLSDGTDGEVGDDAPDPLPPVTGADGATPTPVELPTGTMGYGNVRITLKLAAARLAQMGITEPTSEQLSAVLLGGEIDGVSLDGILNERAAGAGWGEIAHRHDLKVGQLMGNGKAGVEVVAGQDGELVVDDPLQEAVEQAEGGQQAAAVGAASAPGTKRIGSTAALGKASGVGKVHKPRTDHSARAANGYIPSGKPGGYGSGIVTAGGTSVGVAAGRSGQAKGHLKAGTAKAVHGQGGGIVSAGNASASASLAAAGGRGLAKGPANGKR